jgi:hypothetical protein
MHAKRREGRLYCVTGATRSGKTLWTAQEVAPASRLLVWDLLGEWAARYRCRRIGSLRELAAAIDGRERIAFHRPGMVEDFDAFCRLAFIFAQLRPGVVVIEETATVTSPGRAPPAWGDLVRMGLRYGVDLYALTQRPAESDKTAFGNASVIHCGRAVTPRDRATVAQYLDVPVSDVAQLQPLEFIERHAGGQLIRGRVNTNKRT